MVEFNGITADKLPEALKLFILKNAEEFDNGDYRIAFMLREYDYNYCIVDGGFDASNGDIHGAIEESLHLLLDAGATPDDIRAVMGLVQESELDPDYINEDDVIHIDLGYVLDGPLYKFETAPNDYIVINSLDGGLFSQSELARARRAPYSIGIHDLSLIVSPNLTDWQANRVIDAYNAHLDPAIIEQIAKPQYSHAQMRELFELAQTMRLKEGMLTPKRFETKVLSHIVPATPPDLIRALKEYGADLGIFGLESPDGLAVEWEYSDAMRLVELGRAVRNEVDVDLIREMVSKKLPADSIYFISRAYLNGAESDNLYAMCDSWFTTGQMETLMHIASDNTNGLTAEGFRFLANPEYSPDRIRVLYHAIVFDHLTLEDIKPYNDGRFFPEQMEAIYENIGLGVNQNQIAAIANPSLNPDEMYAIGTEIICDNVLSGFDKRIAATRAAKEQETGESLNAAARDATEAGRALESHEAARNIPERNMHGSDQIGDE